MNAHLPTCEPEQCRCDLPERNMVRHFKGTGESSGAQWGWDGRNMWTLEHRGWELSLFIGPKDLLACLDVVETDEDGEELQPSAEDIAAEKGDREQQRIADLS